MSELIYIHRSKQKWVSFKDEPPPKDDTCLIYALSSDGEHGFYELMSPNTNKISTMSFLETVGITPIFWMKIPEPPLRGKKKRKGSS
tara:strand:+ start:258 stop:518 length:261 start_codon:yes stop_codon:yes gene_type:complete